jgi:hypothetical protein
VVTNPFRPLLTEGQRLLRSSALLTSLLGAAAVVARWDVAAWVLVPITVAQLVTSTVWEWRTRHDRLSPFDHLG